MSKERRCIDTKNCSSQSILKLTNSGAGKTNSSFLHSRSNVNKNNVPERGVNQFLSLVPSSMLDYRGRKNGGEFTFFMRHLYATLRDKSIKCVLIKGWNSWVTKGVGETLIWFLNLLFPTHCSLLIMELKYISFNCENATKRIVKQKPQLSHQNHPLSIELLNTRHNTSANRVKMKRIDNKIENWWWWDWNSLWIIAQSSWL